MAFVQIFNLIFGQQLVGYSTILKSAETTFQILLGKFSLQPLQQAQPVFGPLLFLAINIVIILFLINIFVTIYSAELIGISDILIDSFD
jgi:membrane-associated protease RseP (regulator of RpoE activity)